MILWQIHTDQFYPREHLQNSSVESTAQGTEKSRPTNHIWRFLNHPSTAPPLPYHIWIQKMLLDNFFRYSVPWETGYLFFPPIDSVVDAYIWMTFNQGNTFSIPV